MALAYAPLVTSTRLTSQEHSADVREQGKCDLDTAAFYWEYDKISMFGLSLAILACVLTIHAWSVSRNAKAILLAVFNAVIGVACIFLPYIAGNLAKLKVVEHTCHVCHCSPEERAIVVDQASLCILFVLMSKAAVAAILLGIFDIILCCVMCCTRGRVARAAKEERKQNKSMSRDSA